MDSLNYCFPVATKIPTICLMVQNYPLMRQTVKFLWTFPIWTYLWIPFNYLFSFVIKSPINWQVLWCKPKTDTTFCSFCMIFLKCEHTGTAYVILTQLAIAENTQIRELLENNGFLISKFTFLTKFQHAVLKISNIVL